MSNSATAALFGYPSLTSQVSQLICQTIFFCASFYLFDYLIYFGKEIISLETLHHTKIMMFTRPSYHHQS